MNAAYAKAAWPKRRDCNFIILSGKASLFGFGVCMMRCLKTGAVEQPLSLSGGLARLSSVHGTCQQLLSPLRSNNRRGNVLGTI